VNPTLAKCLQDVGCGGRGTDSKWLVLLKRGESPCACESNVVVYQ
jgi:hypothetical protein